MSRPPNQIRAIKKYRRGRPRDVDALRMRRTIQLLCYLDVKVPLKRNVPFWHQHTSTLLLVLELARKSFRRQAKELRTDLGHNHEKSIFLIRVWTLLESRFHKHRISLG